MGEEEEGEEREGVWAEVGMRGSAKEEWEQPSFSQVTQQLRRGYSTRELPTPVWTPSEFAWILVQLALACSPLHPVNAPPHTAQLHVDSQLSSNTERQRDSESQ